MTKTLRVRMVFKHFAFRPKRTVLGQVLHDHIPSRFDVFCDLAQQGCRDVPASGKRHRRAASRGIAKLLVRSPLPDFGEAKRTKNGYHLGRLQDGNVPHGLRDGDVLHPDKLRFEYRVAVLQQHLDDFAKVAVEFIEGRALRMRSRKTGYEPHEQASLGIALDHGGEIAHRVASEKQPWGRVTQPRIRWTDARTHTS